MSESHEPGRRPAGSKTPPDNPPPKTDADAARQEPHAAPAGMEGEGAGENRDAAEGGEPGGMLSQGGERDRKTGGMLGEG